MGIRKIRESLLMTQAEFAKIIGVSTNTVSMWEIGKSRASLKHKKKIKEICVENKIDFNKFEIKKEN